MKKIRIALAFGTRPEIIKFLPIVRELDSRNIPYYLIHTGQHYTFEMDRIFFSEFGIGAPKYNFRVGSGTHAVQTSKGMVRVEEVLSKEDQNCILVQGDTNSTLAAALAAAKLSIPIGHVEAGLRSFDSSMPEEINRRLTDAVSTVFFAPTEVARRNLLREGFSDSDIYLTGNTVVDSIKVQLAQNGSRGALPNGARRNENLVVATFHRPENVDSRDGLKSIVAILERVSSDLHVGVVWPMHPRTARSLQRFRVPIPKAIRILGPLGYTEFLNLEREASVILTDSGGVQEEACVLGVPCITVRNTTERPETVHVGANILAYPRPGRVVDLVHLMRARGSRWANPLGDGRSAQKIVSVLLERFSR